MAKASPKLIVEGPDGEQPLPLAPERPAVAGRLATCDVVLDDAQSSRQHFEIVPRGPRYHLKDLGSRNGTLLNEQRAGDKLVPLRHGDKIRVGESVVRYESGARPLKRGTEVGGVAVGKRIGRSDYGLVYAGRQAALDRDVTVEVLDPDLAADPKFLKRYQSRAREGGKFEHTGILAVYDTVADDEVVCTVFEAFPGAPLEERLESESPDEGEAFDILEQVALALAHVHSRGKQHGCLNPRAVLVDDSGKVKLTGLGERPRARLRKHRQDALFMASYASPEEADGDDPTPESDVFSLGALAVHLLAGRPPYRARQRDKLLDKLAGRDPVPVEDFDLARDVEDALAELLEKEPEDRPSAEEAAELFAELAGRGKKKKRKKKRGRRRAGSLRSDDDVSRSASADGVRPKRSKSADELRPKRSKSADELRPKRSKSADEVRPTSGSDLRERRAEKKQAEVQAPQRRKLSSAPRAGSGQIAPIGEDESLGLRLGLVLLAYGLLFAVSALFVRVLLKL